LLGVRRIKRKKLVSLLLSFLDSLIIHHGRVSETLSSYYYYVMKESTIVDMLKSDFKRTITVDSYYKDMGYLPNSREPN